MSDGRATSAAVDFHPPQGHAGDPPHRRWGRRRDRVWRSFWPLALPPQTTITPPQV